MKIRLEDFENTKSSFLYKLVFPLLKGFISISNIKVYQKQNLNLLLIK